MMKFDYKLLICSLCIVGLLGLVSCFTGVENTPKITDKDVQRTMSELERRQPTMTITPYVDSLVSWRVGKQFYVTDSQVALILQHSADIDLDTIKMVGETLTYKGYDVVTGVDNRDVVDLRFSLGGNVLTYHTGKTLTEIPPAYSIPLLIDMDMVNHVSIQLAGREVYIKTPIWYDSDKGYMMHGRQFIKVRIDGVLPGNKVLPLKVAFTASDNGQKAFVWMSLGGTSVNNRDYDSLFTSRDVHDNYPDISAENWNLIIKGDVALNMTKEECRLSMGAPKSISRMPNQSEVREYWYYDGGAYLQFVDGLLRSFRK